jgi:stalled ribosome rescue protein Dom34
MESKKTAGIWMDHSVANLIDLNAPENNHSTNSKFTFTMKEETLSRSEKTMHNKRQQLQEMYYKELKEEILKYDHVLLFGPTDAKTELSNYLKEDTHFKHIKIDVESTDKISDNEQIAFVKKHFTV